VTRRPRITVTGPRRGGRILTWLNLLAVWRAGGDPIAVEPGYRARLQDVDGMVIGGGENIDAVLYDDKIRLQAVPDRARDKLELEALDIAEKKSLPVLGICRGSQLINVFRGGTLNPDSYGKHGGPGRHRSLWPRKDVRVAEWSKIFSLIGIGDCIRVNCLHEQSVDRLGDGLKACAEDTLGITQGIEDPGSRFVIGVQWHPELLVWRNDQTNIFRGLVMNA